MRWDPSLLGLARAFGWFALGDALGFAWERTWPHASTLPATQSWVIVAFLALWAAWMQFGLKPS